MAGHPSTTVIFRDVAVYFSEKEWQNLEEWQRDLYTGVIKEIHGILISLGFVILNPNNLLRIQSEEEPCSKSCQSVQINESRDVASDGSVNPDILLTVQPGEKQHVADSFGQNKGRNNSFPSTSKFIDKFGEYTAIKEEAHLQHYSVTPTTERLDNTIKCYPSNDQAVSRIKLEGQSSNSNSLHLEVKHGIRYAAGKLRKWSKNHDSNLCNFLLFLFLLGYPIIEPVTLKAKQKEHPSNTENIGLIGRNTVNYTVEDVTVNERKQGTERLSIGNISAKSKVKVQYSLKDGGFCQRMLRSSIVNKDELTHKLYLSGSQRPIEPERSYNCVECGKRFSKISDLRLHQASHRMKMKPFNGCIIQLKTNPRVQVGQKLASENFSHAGSVKNISGAKSVTCVVYDKNGNANSVMQSQKTLMRERRFICKFCGKRFQNNSNLIGHERIHTGEKPFECQECGKTFSQKANLTTHQRLHTGERPFVCINCGKGFAQKINLLTHEKTHTKKRKKIDNKTVMMN
ncbi:zinc finger protein 436 [Bombina bombina]|uniref:zinc finger protein 436 n=1 Tax=Bombina bombina TaxID=8345 RepID=UPI00235AE6C1|nr:zinc finger protein 436 [Bombina bombina]